MSLTAFAVMVLPVVCAMPSSASSSWLTTVSGTGEAGYSGDGGLSSAAQLNQPDDVAFDAVGNAYVADAVNHVVRKIDPNGVITTFAGNGSEGDGADPCGAPATSVGLGRPTGVAVLERFGTLDVYIADEANHVVWEVRDGQIIPAPPPF